MLKNLLCAVAVLTLALTSSSSLAARKKSASRRPDCESPLLPSGFWASPAAEAMRAQQLRALALHPRRFARLAARTDWNVRRIGGLDFTESDIARTVRYRLGENPRVSHDGEGRVRYENEEGTLRVTENLVTRTFTVEQLAGDRRVAFLDFKGRPLRQQQFANVQFSTAGHYGLLTGNLVNEVHSFRTFAAQLPAPAMARPGAPSNARRDLSLAAAIARFLGTDPSAISLQLRDNTVLITQRRLGVQIEDHPGEQYFRVRRILGQAGLPIDAEGAITADGEAPATFFSYRETSAAELSRPLAALPPGTRDPQLSLPAWNETTLALAHWRLSETALEAGSSGEARAAAESLDWNYLSESDRAYFLPRVAPYRAEVGGEWTALITLARRSGDPAWLPVLEGWLRAIAASPTPYHRAVREQLDATIGRLRRRLPPAREEELLRAAE